MKFIPLTGCDLAMVDDADYPAVSQFRWHTHRVKRSTYAARYQKSREGKWTKQLLHRFLLPGIPGIDHKDGNGLNCQRYNLRPATKTQNRRASLKKAKNTSSQFRGVSWHHRDQRWQADISADGESYYLGQFHSEENAARAYDKAALQYFGEYASPNFPNNKTK